MANVFCFLRAINVGGRRLSMVQLADALTGLGLGSVETFLASGNAVFDHPGDSDLEKLAKRVETGLADHLGYRSEIFLRTRPALADLLEAAEATRDSGTIALNIALLRTPADAAVEAALAPWQSAVERFTLADRAFIWTASAKISQTPFGLKGYQSKAMPVMTVRTANTFARMLARWSVG
jgi:uncharacterized protein (DUF1697 family)